jgi:hypothetical protein
MLSLAVENRVEKVHFFCSMLSMDSASWHRTLTSVLGTVQKKPSKEAARQRAPLAAEAASQDARVLTCRSRRHLGFLCDAKRRHQLREPEEQAL